MVNAATSTGGRPRIAVAGPSLSPEHYLRIILHRKWLVIAVFVLVSAGTAIYSYRMPDTFTSDTLILVDPQKVPESYVKSTVTGDVRNRLGTLSQQILSTTRLQKIIDTLNLYPKERKTLAREDLISIMRSHISVGVVSDFGGTQDLQAFRIGFSGSDPRVVAQVANEVASLFIDENLKAREQQATGTTEFLQNQLQEARKVLDDQEARLKDFKLKHIGEMPEQQAADLQILGQLQSQQQLEGDALARAEQQKSMIQTMMAQSAAPVVDLDGSEPSRPPNGSEGKESKPAAVKAVNPTRAQLDALLARGYTENHPAIKKLRAELAEEESKKVAVVAPEVPVPVNQPAPVTEPPVKRTVPVPVSYANPVLQSQMATLEAEIAKHKQEQQRLNKLIAGYQGKLEAIPVREQEITGLVRDHEMSKVHYSQLLGNQFSAETATQLEIRQKGEKFTILDPAQPAERPSSPNRGLINAAGSVAGLGLGLLLAMITEFVGMSITTAEQITDSTGIPVLEVIPIIQTYTDRVIHRRRLIWATASGVVLCVLASGAVLLYHFRS
jgi:polysaccharide chain length determinant protein (PEP-CTERM system associated)